MSQQPWARNVQAAFQHDAALMARVFDVANRYQNEVSALLGDIALYITSQDQDVIQVSHSKKRKLDETSQPTNGTAQPKVGITNPVVSFECKDVSFQVPVRKKLRLQVISDSNDARQKEVRLLSSQTGDTEFTLNGAQIDQIFCLPVPEKQQRQWNFCILPQTGAVSANGAPCEQMVFAMAETKPTGATSASRAIEEQDTYVTVTEPELNRLLQPYGKRVIWPTDTEFASSIPQAHRKGEKAYHVKAHRGTKDGYLFFLPNGIVFGFKKPLSFFPFSSVQSISYTSVLQRTFNLVITAMEGDNAEAKEVEFSMLDQADFAGIDEYIKRHGLNDASMAAERRAKAYNVNKDKKGDANGNENGVANGEDEQSELQKAEQQLQDEEDEEEEDYEASGGDSDGEGEDSDEDEDDGHGEEYEGEYDEEEEEDE